MTFFTSLHMIIIIYKIKNIQNVCILYLPNITKDDFDKMVALSTIAQKQQCENIPMIKSFSPIHKNSSRKMNVIGVENL